MTTTVNVTLQGQSYGREQIRELIETINEATRDGIEFNLNGANVQGQGGMQADPAEDDEVFDRLERAYFTAWLKRNRAKIGAKFGANQPVELKANGAPLPIDEEKGGFLRIVYQTEIERYQTDWHFNDGKSSTGGFVVTGIR